MRCAFRFGRDTGPLLALIGHRWYKRLPGQPSRSFIESFWDCWRLLFLGILGLTR